MADGRQARWELHNQQRRQDILDAALAVLSDAEPGAEFHVQQIAERAGLNRTVVYRHFEDRGELERAIQTRIVDDLTSRLVPDINLDGTIREIILRIVSDYVDWVVAHPALHRFADQSSGSFEEGIDQIGRTLVHVLETVIELLDVQLDDAERAGVEPLAYGLVGAVIGAVRRWVTRTPLEPAPDRLSALLADSVWHLLDGHARRLGLALDPDVPIAEILGTPEPGSG